MKELFKNLGANEKEMETFLKLLELGAQPVSVIARHVSVPRSTMYLILENLKKLDLVEEFERATIKYFKCIPVADLPNILKTREAKVKQTLAILNDTLPELKKLENQLSITPKIKFFEGKDAVTKMYEEVLKEKGFYAYFNPQIDNSIMISYFKKVADTIKKNKLNVKEFVIAGPQAKKYVKDCNSKNHKIKILPKSMTFDSDTIICKDKIYMVSYDKQEVSAIKIFSEPLIKTQRAIFGKMWEIL